MTELTTGMMFLLSSMYGGAGLTIDTANLTPITGVSNAAIAVMAANTDRKALIQYLEEHFADTPILIDIARCESEFTHYDKKGRVVRGRVDDADVGVMQINERYHLETAKKLGIDIHTVDGNIAYAKYLYEKSGSKPWNASKPCWNKAKTVAMK